jgi:hypothetical protein
MAITTRDQLIAALATNSSRIVLDKASMASQVAGRMCSMWRSTGLPAQGAIPAAAAICDNTLLASNSAMSWEIHDRLAHRGGGKIAHG